MAAPTSPADLSATVASNGPDGATEQVSVLDDYIRGLSASVKHLVVKGADIPSAATITPAATASFFDITGTTGITAIGSTNSWDGRIVWFQFDGALTITHASTLKLPGAVNYTTAAGDVLAFVQETSGTWRCINIERATQPAFRVLGSASRTTTGDFTSYTESFDQGGNFASGVFTAPVPGLYEFTANAFGSTSAGSGDFAVVLLVNGSNPGLTLRAQPSTTTLYLGGSIIVRLAAADAVKLNLNAVSGTDCAVWINSFCGALIGP